jgi:hypothetical protein
MLLATVQTTASPAALWIMIVVVVLVAATWLFLVLIVGPWQNASRVRAEWPGSREEQEEEARPLEMAGATAARQAMAAGSGTEQTRDDMPRVPGQRSVSQGREGADAEMETQEPGVQWTAPAQRESATDEPVADQPRGNAWN